MKKLHKLLIVAVLPILFGCNQEPGYSPTGWCHGEEFGYVKRHFYINEDCVFDGVSNPANNVEFIQWYLDYEFDNMRSTRDGDETITMEVEVLRPSGGYTYYAYCDFRKTTMYGVILERKDKPEEQVFHHVKLETAYPDFIGYDWYRIGTHDTLQSIYFLKSAAEKPENSNSLRGIANFDKNIKTLNDVDKYYNVVDTVYNFVEDYIYIDYNKLDELVNNQKRKH